jgi:uncharacterized FAD-dependent dehydrogenase
MEMSNYKRDAKNANSAVVVMVGKDDFGSDLPLSGHRVPKTL